MLEVENIYIDKLNDKLGIRLREFLVVQNWNKEKHNLVRELFKEIRRQEFIQKNEFRSFSGNRPSYWLYGGVGSSLIYKVPQNKRGLLSDYRGKVVRLICIGNDRYKVNFCIQELSERKLKNFDYEYKFPNELSLKKINFKSYWEESLKNHVNKYFGEIILGFSVTRIGIVYGEINNFRISITGLKFSPKSSKSKNFEKVNRKIISSEFQHSLFLDFVVKLKNIEIIDNLSHLKFDVISVS